MCRQSIVVKGVVRPHRGTRVFAPFRVLPNPLFA